MSHGCEVHLSLLFECETNLEKHRNGAQGENGTRGGTVRSRFWFAGTLVTESETSAARRLQQDDVP